MSVQRLVTQGGRVSYRARVKSHGREVATKCFERRADAVAWVSDQTRRIRTGDWVDPRRGRISMGLVADGWLDTRASVKRRTRETDLATWANYVQPTFGNRAIAAGHHRNAKQRRAEQCNQCILFHTNSSLVFRPFGTS